MKLRYKYCLSAASLTAILLLLIGAGWTEQPRGVIMQTAPLLSGLNPNSVLAGSPGFILTVNGAYFGGNSVVRWNGADLPTTIVNDTVVRAQVPASDVASAGTADVTVDNPIFPNGQSGVSNVLALRIIPASSF